MVEPSSGLAWHLQRIPIIWPVLAPWPAWQLPRAAWRLPRSAQSPSARQTRVSKSKVKALSVSPAAYVATAFKNPAMQATSYLLISVLGYFTQFLLGNLWFCALFLDNNEFFCAILQATIHFPAYHQFLVAVYFGHRNAIIIWWQNQKCTLRLQMNE